MLLVIARSCVGLFNGLFHEPYCTLPRFVHNWRWCVNHASLDSSFNLTVFGHHGLQSCNITTNLKQSASAVRCKLIIALFHRTNWINCSQNVPYSENKNSFRQLPFRRCAELYWEMIIKHSFCWVFQIPIRKWRIRNLFLGASRPIRKKTGLKFFRLWSTCLL